MAGTPSIPASAIVNITPGVVGAGGSGLDLVGLILTNSTRAPVGSILRFGNAADVSTYFGPVSQEAMLAAIYFAGYTGSTIAPASLLFAQYAAGPVNAYLRGGALGLTLTQVQAITPNPTKITIDGRTITSATINLSSATSLSNAAQIIQTALGDYDATFTGSVTGTTLTASSVTGTIAIGQVLSGPGVTAGTTITARGTGTGGAGTYTVSVSQTVASGSLQSGATTVAYDTVSGAFVITAGTPGTSTIGYADPGIGTSLGLTQDRGAVLSQGAVASTPGGAMDAVIATTQDFVSFMTTFEPSTADALAFALWNNGKNNRYLYVSWDTDVACTLVPDTTSLGYQIGQLGYSGTALIYDPSNGAQIASFLMGTLASIDFTKVAGRVNAAFRSGGTLVAGVNSQAVAANIDANGYNGYEAYATANAQFVFFYKGRVSGKFAWIDSYINQVWMNNGFQLLAMQALTNLGSIPYNAAGYAQIEQIFQPQIDSAVSFGAIRAGVTLSLSQIQQVNAQAGKNISDTLQQRGWYMLVSPATPTVRAARGPVQAQFFYTDGQSILSINLASVLVA